MQETTAAKMHFVVESTLPEAQTVIYVLKNRRPAPIRGRKVNVT